MTKSLPLSHVSFLFVRSKFMAMPRVLSLLLPHSKFQPFNRTTISLSPSSQTFSTTSTPYPLYYEMILNRPTQSQPAHTRRRPLRLSESNSENSPELESMREAKSELGLDGWIDQKLGSEEEIDQPRSGNLEMDRAKRKYFSKRRKRMYGSDSDEENRRPVENFVELKPEVVELPTLHKREEELYFYDTFAYPWEKAKHYKMVYQLEKKYFPDQCLDKAFLEPGESNVNVNANVNDNVNAKDKLKSKKKLSAGMREKKDEVGDEIDDKKLVFFDGKGEGINERKSIKDASKDLTEKKVEDFFKCLKKVPSKDAGIGNEEPYLVKRSTALPPRWDGPYGTVVLVNKPKGWTSFTVCGKLRRLVNVKKVGHAGTLDPMATGLLIVCIGKATKVVDRYQGMIKGYSGVFRLGEATSTWDADSPVIQREPWEHIKDEDIKKAASSFCGEIWQVPPMFSAIKVGGEKMYDKARRGESVELSPRRISIFQFDIERSLDDRQNLIFRVTCSKGTYIRSLCADLGKALGSCAHLTALRRDSIGQYTADDAWDFEELEEAIKKSYFGL
ncbi:putative tRNA-pseudouridine synthase [Quillaja saponaria]|uniref:tRNA pseudouridine(55) synthase n=1 Tax=Quillaja saponaria TaxID=32244 RepID=A0AAD7Q4M9_QUISA|nr:putative tRNA-pseudouridine synthase [Quillaja saponaria]